MSKITPPDSQGTPVIRVSYQSSLGAQRGAVFETYLPLDAPKKLLDAILDKLRVVCDRQEAIAKVVEIQDRIISEKATVDALAADKERQALMRVEKWNSSGRKGDFKLTAAEYEHDNNMEGSIRNRQATVKLLESELARYTKIVEAE